MSEGEFKPIRITLSEEAFRELDTIMEVSKFRSYSSAIEECIRAVYDIGNDIFTVLGSPGEPRKTFDREDAFWAFVRIVTRMSRLTERVVVGGPTPKK